MLVLSRKPQERILIGSDITVTIIRVKGNTVRVGIEAPEDIRILRAELPPKDSKEKERVETPLQQVLAARREAWATASIQG